MLLLNIAFVCSGAVIVDRGRIERTPVMKSHSCFSCFSWYDEEYVSCKTSSNFPCRFSKLPLYS